MKARYRKVEMLAFLLIMAYHGLYGSTSCCISHGPCQWKRAIFDPHSSETPGLIFMKLEIYNYFLDMTQHAKQNFRGLCQRWWSGQIASFTHESFCPFFRFFARPTGRISGHTPTRNTSLYIVLAKVVSFGG